MRLVKRMNIQFSFGFNFKIEKRVIGERRKEGKAILAFSPSHQQG
jgi:hypothetical protein